MARRRASAAAAPAAAARRRTLAIVASVVILVAVPVVVLVLASGEDASTGAPQAAAEAPASSDPLRPAAPFFANAGDGVRPGGIGCTATAGTRLRVRSHLDLYADGRRIAVPGGIGVLPSCRYWLRTDAPGGVVTIASPERREFTVGELFDIWGAPLSSTRFLGFRLGPRRRLHAVVDGRIVDGDPRAIRLVDGREVALYAGREPRGVPSTYDFGPAGSR